MEENFATTLPSPLPLPGPLSLSQPLFYLPLSRVAVTANPRVGTALNRADGAMLGCQPGLCSSWTTEAHHTFLIGGPLPDSFATPIFSLPPQLLIKMPRPLRPLPPPPPCAPSLLSDISFLSVPFVVCTTRVRWLLYALSPIPSRSR